MYTIDQINEYLNIIQNLRLEEEKKLPITVFIRRLLLLINVVKVSYVTIVE